MDSAFGRRAIFLAKKLQQSGPSSFVPPSFGARPDSQGVIPHALVSGTRGYIEKVVFQINGCYENGWFDGCAVMMRRLIETLIIECFESKGISDQIRNSNGDFHLLNELIARTLSETSWNLSRNTRNTLKRLKQLGDLSAHNRRYNATRNDIDQTKNEFRVACEELLYISKLKR